MKYQFNKSTQYILSDEILTVIKDEIPTSAISDLTHGQLKDEGESYEFKVVKKEYPNGIIYLIYEKTVMFETYQLSDSEAELLRNIIQEE